MAIDAGATRHARRSWLLTVGLALVLVLTACSGSADGASPASTTAPRPARKTVQVETRSYGRSSTGAPLRLDLYRSTKAPPAGGRPLIVLVHGGGFYSGTRTEYRAEARKLAERGWVVAAVDYELSTVGAKGGPQAALKALNVALSDVQEALHWLIARADAFGFDPDRIVSYGESAGGTTSTGLAYMGPGPHLVKAAVSASGRSDPLLFSEFGQGDRPVMFVSWDQDDADDVPIQKATCAWAGHEGISCRSVVLHGNHHGLDITHHIDLLEGFYRNAAGIEPS